MRKLLLVCGVLFVSTVGFAKSNPMPFSSCVDEIYQNAGARSMEEARITCRMQNDERFVRCATDLYNDLDRGYSSERAIGVCLDRYPGQSIHTSCVTILGSAGFDRMSAIELCDETTDTLSLAIPKCIYRQSLSNSNSIVDDCREAFERGQLNSEGFDRNEFAQIQKENELRRAQEAAARREQAARAEAQRQRQVEAARRKAQQQAQLQAQRQAEVARAAEARRQAELDRKQDMQNRKDRLARQRAEEKSAQNNVRRAEEIRRQEEERNYNDMVREENARQARERQKQANKQTQKKKEKRDVAVPTPKEDIPSKKTKKSEDKPNNTVKKDQGGNDSGQREDDLQRKTDEGRDRVERAKREAEERRKQQENQKKSQEGQTSDKKSDSGTEDVPPPPVSEGDFTDLPNPTAN